MGTATGRITAMRSRNHNYLEVDLICEEAGGQLLIYTRGQKLPPDRKDKIERMRHKSFLVYLLALYVIGWK